MPARKNPVKKRSISKLLKLLLSKITAILNRDPINAHKKKTLEGENRSAMVNSANINVPVINPNCTAEVRWLTESIAKSKLLTREDITPLLANQREVQQN